MAGITTNDSVVTFKKAATWNTAVAVTSGFKLKCSTFSPTGGFQEFLSRDNGFSKKPTETVRLNFDGTISVTCDLTYNQPWMALVASVMGTESSPSETTVSQGDYTRNIDLADSTYGSAAIFWSMAWTTEDSTGAKIIELPSVKFNAFTIQSDSNGVGTVTITGVFDRFVVSSWTSTYANVTGVSETANYEAAVLGGTNAYCRINASSGGSLNSSNNIPIEYYSLSINRPIKTQHSLRAANSPYIIEPKEIDRIDGFFTIRLQEINATTLDLLDQWANKTAQKAELFFDGAAIASGVNTSQKYQMPKLVADSQFPDGFGLPNNNSLMTPTIKYRMIKATSAPTGMTGVTDLLRIVPIDRRSTKWTA